MESDQVANKKDTIEEQSKRVKEASQILRNEIEDFLEIGKTEANVKAGIAPTLDAIAQISDNLALAEQALKSARDYFGRLKARIRG